MSRKKPEANPKDPEQLARFKEMARELEADESPDALDRAFSSLDTKRKEVVSSDADTRKAKRKVGKKATAKKSQ